MRKSYYVIALGLMLIGAAGAHAQTADVMKTINQFVNGFNKGDVSSAVAACAAETSIIDEFPPFEWGGADACKRWTDDYTTDAGKNGITDGAVTLGKARHVIVSGDRAYAVIPSNYVSKVKGKRVAEIGAMFTFALQKFDSGWKITGWSWAKK